MNRLPKVTVLVPARDESAAIARCIEHIARQDYPTNRIELLVVDGASSDDTAALARRAMTRLGIADGHVLHNAAATTPSNLNAGLAKATGDVLCRVDARSFIEPHYVRTCVEVLQDRLEVAVVGGAQVAMAGDRHPVSVGIARALNNRWSMGFARYRSGQPSGPADTVYLGAFRTEELRAAGGWDERLVTNQDFELNRRMAERGAVWFDERLRSSYVPRASIGLLWRQYRRFGAWKVRYWRVTGDRPQARQRLLLAAVPVAGVLGAVALRKAPTATVAAGLVGALAVEVLGADEPEGDALAHGAGVVAMVTVGLGWWSGVVSELTRRGAGPDG